MKSIAISLILILLYSCNTNTSTTKQKSVDVRSETFRHYLKKFQPIELPFVFRYANYEEQFDFDKMPSFDLRSADTLFINTDNGVGIKCFGVLPDTSEFFALIYFFAADSYYPEIVTYNKQGLQIDKTALIVNGCGGDCGLKYCSETGTINSDLSIECADSLYWEFFCDSIGEPIPESEILYIDSQKGQISKTGLINMSGNKHQEITTRLQ